MLAAIRREMSLGQDALAEKLGVAPKTLQAWEQGRNPLIHLSYSRLRLLLRALLAGGAPAELVRTLEIALSADDILSGLGVHDPNLHPLGLVVPDRATTELVAWPLTGVVPRRLRGTTASLQIPTGQQDEVIANLRQAADAAGNDEQSAMLRRQAVFFIADHDSARGHSAAWTESQIHDATRVADLRQWSPAWPVARSAAVQAALAGNLEPLHRFVEEGLASEETQQANLTYWAYWVGEYQTPWESDAAMVRAGTGGWSGERLLGSLLDGVVGAPYRELCVHSLWALGHARRALVTEPRWATRISGAVESATLDDSLTPLARRRLEQIHYFVGSTA
ncbi:helix-turn-helix domain-containing protein [Nocardia wallacei]|uniref:helix-turn-helix domain-containing protein n=1 Tax=Nocardia wallacei TaxID=480035 RepID=UPI0024585DF8|nr:helix-turn-helix domain-containing protein [Nocardia wallacei]